MDYSTDPDKKNLIANGSSKSDEGKSSKINDISSVGTANNEPYSLRKTKWRWVALVFAWFFLLGSYFWYDNPNSLSDKLKLLVTHDKDNNEIKYNQLYSVYSYPNVILPLFGGILIDKIGLNFSIILFSSLLVIGQGVFMISGFMGTEDQNDNSAFYVALAGRLIFGLGGESLNVWQSTIVSRWFIGKELSLALGINISVSRLGSVFNNYSMPPIADALSLGFALLFGLSLWIISMICGIILTLFERRAAHIDNTSTDLKENEKDEFHWRDIKDFSLSFWLIAGNCIFTYVGLFWFNNISNDFFHYRYGFTQTEAGRITSNVFLISAFLAPCFGAISDRIGHKVSFCLLSTVSLTLCHILFLVIPSSDSQNKSYLGIIPIVLMGITYFKPCFLIFPQSDKSL